MINFIIRRLYKKLISIELIRADLYRYYGATDYQSFCRALRVPGFEFTLSFRLAILKSKYSLLGIIGRMMYKRLTFKYGFQIPRVTKVGKGLRISHFGAVVVNYDSVIGDNCYLSHNITLGQVSRGAKKGSPKLGNGVWIGPGAIIIGNVTVGDNVLIAGNSFVNFDVPANSLVIGNPGKIVSNENSTEGYVTNVYR